MDSSLNDVISGIPQGTIWSYLPDVCKHFANVYLFADDAKLHVAYNVLYDDDHNCLSSVA